MPDIMHLVRIDTSPERVYEAITTAAGVRRWWTRDAVLEPKIGAVGEFGFNERRFVAKVRVDELAPPARARWTVVAGAPGWGPTITFGLQPGGRGTVLSFAHRGFAHADDGYASATTRWGAYLISLKAYLETRSGSPHPDDLFTTPSLAELRRRRPHALTDGDTVLAAADVPASPERAFRALTTAEVERWWGSAGGYRMTAWSADLRAGGRWSVVPQTADGRTMPASGKFLEIDAPHKVVQTRMYDWDHPRLGRRETTVTYRFDPVAAATRVTVRHDGFAGLTDAAEEHRDGWERVLGELAAYLGGGGARE